MLTGVRCLHESQRYWKISIPQYCVHVNVVIETSSHMSFLFTDWLMWNVCVVTQWTMRRKCCMETQTPVQLLLRRKLAAAPGHRDLPGVREAWAKQSPATGAWSPGRTASWRYEVFVTSEEYITILISIVFEVLCFCFVRFTSSQTGDWCSWWRTFQLVRECWWTARLANQQRKGRQRKRK